MDAEDFFVTRCRCLRCSTGPAFVRKVLEDVCGFVRGGPPHACSGRMP